MRLELFLRKHDLSLFTFFFNQDFLFTIRFPTFLICNLIDNSYLEGTLSQISDLGPSFYFMSKNGKRFFNICQHNFLDIIK